MKKKPTKKIVKKLRKLTLLELSAVLQKAFPKAKVTLDNTGKPNLRIDQDGERFIVTDDIKYILKTEWVEIYNCKDDIEN